MPIACPGHQCADILPTLCNHTLWGKGPVSETLVARMFWGSLLTLGVQVCATTQIFTVVLLLLLFLVWVHRSCGVLGSVKRQQESVLSFHSLGPRNWIQVVRLGVRYCYLLSHPTGWSVHTHKYTHTHTHACTNLERLIVQNSRFFMLPFMLLTLLTLSYSPSPLPN